MKTRDTVLINGFAEYVNSCADNKDEVIKTFRKRIYVDDLNAYLRNKTQQYIDVGVGNVNSRMAIMFEEKDKEHIAFYRAWMGKQGIPLHDVYITYRKKGERMDCQTEYDTVAINEMSLFKDMSIIINHTDLALPGYSKNINKNNFTQMLALIGKERKKEITQDEINLLSSLKQDYWVTVREMLNYRIL